MVKGSLENKKTNAAISAIYECLKELDINVSNKKTFDHMLSYELKCLGFQIPGTAIYDYRTGNICLTNSYMSPDRRLVPRYLSLLNEMNCEVSTGHFQWESQTGTVQYITSFPLIGGRLNKARFKKAIITILALNDCVIPILCRELLYENPRSIIEEAMVSESYSQEEYLPWVPLDHVREILPEHFTQIPSYAFKFMKSEMRPNSTTGLTNIGLPELLMDCMAFGSQGNSTRIELCSHFFCERRNVEKLDDIRNGKTILLTMNDINQDIRDMSYQLGFRRISPDSEMAKKAYGENAAILSNPNAWFVQIYLVGDDHSMTEEYYREGIEWWRKRL
ncbi:MAG: hypothetical protein CVU61_14505 [Deltaproteobacteria bacterium HGW-Deltaproteobacteria-19]|jgi:hypothetical protein|nr:MAG: hypothetical protein CVU61_14505 [Deltaproteobacteria bacterium HGW-Deltaproteobacteria-19]